MPVSRENRNLLEDTQNAEDYAPRKDLLTYSLYSSQQAWQSTRRFSIFGDCYSTEGFQKMLD